jgi:hypothetical protein
MAKEAKAAAEEVLADPSKSSIHESETPKARLWLGVGEVVRLIPFGPYLYGHHTDIEVRKQLVCWGWLRRKRGNGGNTLERVGQ